MQQGGKRRNSNKRVVEVGMDTVTGYSSVRTAGSDQRNKEVEGGDVTRRSGVHVAEGRGWRNRRAERAGFTGRGGISRHRRHAHGKEATGATGRSYVV
jgi:hypothetical protein